MVWVRDGRLSVKCQNPKSRAENSQTGEKVNSRLKAGNIEKVEISREQINSPDRGPW